jgi:hypothetical protein
MKLDPVLARRLKNVLVASQRAENPEFKAMWVKKFDELFLQADQLFLKAE